jgi:hypothetical protein
MTITKTCGAVGAGLSVGVGDGVDGVWLGEGDGVVVATGAETHDTERTIRSASIKR